MAATSDMGELEDTHNKHEDSAKEDAILNGELKNDGKCDDADVADEAEKISQESETEEGMDVDEEEHSKENSSVEQCEDNNEVDGEGDEEDSVDSKHESDNKVDNDAEKSDDEDKSEGGHEPSSKEIGDVDSVGEVMHSENSADSEVHNVEDNTSSDSEETEEVDEESEDTLDSKMNGKIGLNGVQHEQINSAAIVLNDSAETEDDSETEVELDEEDCLPKENGEIHRSPVTGKDDNIIDLDTPDKKGPTKSRKGSLTPRRSSRNLNRSTSYLNEQDRLSSSDEESDIEEVMPEDPLGSSEHHGGEKIVKKTLQPPPTSTIVVKDTKRLVEIASKSSNQNTSIQSSGKKEPTLVIIDTNSILSGRGPIPIAHKASFSHSSTSTYNTLPAALPAQGVYPPNMRATITPIPTPKAQPPQQPPTPILPSLTDDMFVVEAPSFIVPYVYEKPPMNDLRKHVDDIKVKLDKARQQEEEKKAAEKKKKREEKDDDYDGTESDEESDEKKAEASVKEGKASPDVVLVKETKKSHLFFDSPIGKFFVDIGIGLVQEFVQTDLLKQQKRKRDREHGLNHETNRTIQSLIKNLEFSKENNEAFHMEIKKCEFCNYKTESALAMKYHLETPHMKNYVYKCNFCPFEVRSPHDILLHMESEHCLRGRLERAPAFHQCPSCPFEDNQKGKLSRHLVACARKFKPERNLEPPLDWEPPAKIPRVPRLKPNILGGPLNSTSAAAAAAAMYQAMAKSGQYNILPKMQGVSPTNSISLQAAAAALQQQAALNRGRGRPSLAHAPKQALPQHMMRAGQMSGSPGSGGGMVFKQTMSGGSVLLPAGYQLSGPGGNQLYQVVGKELSGRLGGPMTFVPNLNSATGITLQSPSNKKTSHQPSISITPVPRGGGGSSSSTSSSATGSTGLNSLKPGDSSGSKSSFVICEICDGYIKDLEQLRNHMQWIHKVKIHPKMIYNRPPLNCQKCQFRFFTDQGLERHLLGSHGLVTSSMQEAANKNNDSGRCPVCGRVFQWKLLNHVARDHNMTLKPAHLSYKCTVCTATFGMYKQFENHVYSAHSVVAKRVMDKKQQAAQQVAAAAKQLGGSSGESILKPLKINDEITIIPQMSKSTTITSTSAGGSSNGTSAAIISKNAVKLNQVVAAATAAAVAAAQQQVAAAQIASSSQGSEVVNTALSRAERLARRKTSVAGEN